MISIEELYSMARELGFAEAKLCAPDGFTHAKAVVESQEPLAERRQLRYFPGKDDPRIKSLAVLLWPYLPARTGDQDHLFVDSYYQASNAAYHAARELENRMTDSGCFAKANVPYPAKEAAIRAGMGVIGHNSLLITPEYGSRVVIILMATDIELPAQSVRKVHHASCVGCGKCVKACPSGAIDEKGMTHPERCLRNFMMEGVVVPEHLRKKLGMRLIGCDICQRVCPMQPRFSSASAGQAHALSGFITEDPDRFSQSAKRLAAEIGRNAARPQRIRAQAALLAGNSGEAACLPVLRQWAESPFEAVRVHAQWAIREIELGNANT